MSVYAGEEVISQLIAAGKTWFLPRILKVNTGLLVTFTMRLSENYTENWIVEIVIDSNELLPMFARHLRESGKANRM